MWYIRESNVMCCGSGLLAAFVCLSLTASDAASGAGGKGSFTLWQEWTGIRWGDAVWGDFDGDGDLDLVYGGGTQDLTKLTQTYENQDGVLVFRQDLIAVHGSGNHHMAWGDYDGDGDLDLAIASQVSSEECIARIYENDGIGNLSWDTQQFLTGVLNAAVAWGDYDSDGDLDLVVTGMKTDEEHLSVLYRNDPLGMFSPDATVLLRGLQSGSADWADYDNDGDLDLLLTGEDVAEEKWTIFYENDPVGTLTDTGSHGLPGVYYTSDAAWGDYDNDGDLDLAILGGTGGGGITRVYRNDGGGSFAQVFQPLNINGGGCAWGDYDNDGDLDLAFNGSKLWPYVDYNRIYENTGAGFSQAVSLVGICLSSASWADVDQDGDLDYMFTGNSHAGPYYARLCENTGQPSNTPPSPPTKLQQEWTADGLLLSWSGASDAETPVDGLYYCLRVGTSPGAHDIMSGTYGSPLMGNVGQATQIVLDVPEGYYDWSLRAIDSGLMNSEWYKDPCPVDIFADGIVDILDVLIVLATWGPCPPEGDCPGDANLDGSVDVLDLLEVLSAWGPCP